VLKRLSAETTFTISWRLTVANRTNARNISMLGCQAENVYRFLAAMMLKLM
jgi:hypothetical protein